MNYPYAWIISILPVFPDFCHFLLVARISLSLGGCTKMEKLVFLFEE
jgi:hypothetical protein